MNSITEIIHIAKPRMVDGTQEEMTRMLAALLEEDERVFRAEPVKFLTRSDSPALSWMVLVTFKGGETTMVNAEAI